MLSFLFNRLLEVCTIRKKKKKKPAQKEKKKNAPFADEIIIYVKNSKESIQNPPKISKEVQQDGRLQDPHTKPVIQNAAQRDKKMENIDGRLKIKVSYVRVTERERI